MITECTRSGLKVTARRPTRSVIRDSSMAVAGAAWARRLAQHQHGDGLAFAVALGLQERRRSAVWKALPPIAAGHALSVGLVVALVAVIQAGIPHQVLRWSAAPMLIGFGIYRLVRARHPQWVGMRVGFRDLPAMRLISLAGRNRSRRAHARSLDRCRPRCDDRL